VRVFKTTIFGPIPILIGCKLCYYSLNFTNFR